jgi:hypothetical protein
MLHRVNLTMARIQITSFSVLGTDNVSRCKPILQHIYHICITTLTYNLWHISPPIFTPFGLTLSHRCACPKSGPELPTSYVMVFVNVQLVKVKDDCSLSCIFGMVDNHCLYVLFIFENDIIIHDLCWCIFVQIDKTTVVSVSSLTWFNRDIY